jgi:hypothetical protein
MESAMARYMIEINHTSDHEGCIQALDAIVRHGSHLVTNAEFGCADGVHAGWLIVDADSKEEACRIVPPPYREGARVVLLRTWTKDEIKGMIEELES